MRGHVKRKDGNWYVVLELDRERGKRKQKWISVRKELGLNKKATRSQAEELLIKKLRELQQGIYFDPEDMTVAEFLDRWMETYGETNLKKNTYNGYESFIRLHIKPEIGSILLSKLKPAHLQNFYSKKLKKGRADGKQGGLSARSVRYIHMILREALSHAVKWEVIPRNVAEAVTPPKEEKSRARTWTKEEAQAFLRAVSGHRLYPLYLLAISTGMRRGEILGLRWQDIDWNKGVISISQAAVATKEGLVIGDTKTDASQRTVAIPPSVLEALKLHRQRQREEAMVLGKPEITKGLIFTSQKGTPINPSNLIRHFKNIISKTNLPQLTFHDIRHTHATIMLQNGVHPKIVSERLGHSRISTTMDIYSHVMPDMQADAALKFEECFLGVRTEREMPCSIEPNKNTKG